MGAAVIATILVSGLIALAAVNAAWWWRRDRRQRIRVRVMKAQRDSTRLRRDYWMRQATRAEAELHSLEERNQLLTDLIGGDHKCS